MSPTTKHLNVLQCVMILVMTISLSSCDEESINTPDEASATLGKSGQTRNVLPIREVISSKGVFPEDGDYTLAGQVTYKITQVNGATIDLELGVELELRPPGGEERGWKIGNVSMDRLVLTPQTGCTFQKTYLIDETDKTRKLNLIYRIDRGELTLLMARVSRTKFDEANH